MKLLQTISSPADLRRLPERDLPALAAELRGFLVDSVSRTGGHLASNLGTVELTLALHYIYNTPYDRLVWDVGHQTYVHKILTGRREGMEKLRQRGGVAGFPRREESEYDAFVAGHSSTSISAALGMAVAARLEGSDRRSVAIIGDGAMTGGMAFEALNNAGAMDDANLLVVLNDNEMSIAPNVGAVHNYLAKVLTGSFYTGLRRRGAEMLKPLPPVREFAKRAEEHVKGMVAPSTLFEAMGFNYVGPVDGHDLDVLLPTLRNLRKLPGPQLLHVITRKGMGFGLAEEDPCRYHGVSTFDPDKGVADSQIHTWSDVFGDWLCEKAKADPRMVAITPAMGEGSGMSRFAREYPDRFFDVGIAEQHAITFAAGLACEGWRPVVAIYSTFLQRGYDQLIHDVCLQDLPILFAIDRAGLVGADGPTHAGVFDLSFLRCVPNMTVMVPTDLEECRSMLDAGLVLGGPAAVRYPRGAARPAPEGPRESLEIGRGELCRQGSRVALLVFGSMLGPALEAGDILGATVANMRFAKPVDDELLRRLAESHELLVTVEENVVMGGAGSACAETLVAAGIPARFVHLGLPDAFLGHGNTAELLAESGLDGAGIVQAVKRIVD